MLRILELFRGHVGPAFRQWQLPPTWHCRPLLPSGPAPGAREAGALPPLGAGPG
jgi:hypothetical protein